MNILNYGVVINDKEASFGLIVDPTEYNLTHIEKKFLYYEVDYKQQIIKIFSDNDFVLFIGLTKEQLYYAIKSETLVIFIGDKYLNESPIGFMEAVIKY